MRILHVSDLHLGRTFGDLSRENEQRALVQELIELSAEHRVAMTLIAGDVYDSFAPPAWAEDLFFELIDGLAAGGRRAVAVIAGNHDSGLRLAAAEPLALRLGIVLAGNIDVPLRPHCGRSDEVRVIPVAPQVARVEIPGEDEAVVAALMPFVSEAAFARRPNGAETETASVYAERLESELRMRVLYRSDSAVNIAMLHQFVEGAVTSDSERPLRARNLADIEARAIPAGFDYVALGHLHRPQVVEGAGSLTMYCGSPIAYSFGEAGQEKRALLVDAVPGRPARVSSLPLMSGRPLEIWAIRSLDEARSRAAAASRLASSRQPIVEVRANFERRLLREELAALYALGGITLSGVRDNFVPTIAVREGDAHAEASTLDLFRELWLRRFGRPPDDVTVGEVEQALLELQRPEDPPLDPATAP